jgi:hypothetical protein
MVDEPFILDFGFLSLGSLRLARGNTKDGEMGQPTSSLAKKEDLLSKVFDIASETLLTTTLLKH